MQKITPKKCLNCKRLIPVSRPRWWKRPMNASHYARLKYCSLRCSSERRNRVEQKWGRKTKKPDIGILNGLWSKTRSYKKMAKELCVSYSAIKKWMGLQKYLLNPLNLYVGEPGEYVKPIKEIKTEDRKEYYRQYYLKRKNKTNSSHEKKRID